MRPSTRPRRKWSSRFRPVRAGPEDRRGYARNANGSTGPAVMCARWPKGFGNSRMAETTRPRAPQRAERRAEDLLRLRLGSEAAHAAHAAHAVIVIMRHRTGLGLRPIGDHRLGGDQEAGDRGGVLQCNPHDLRRIDDAGGDHVLVLAGLRVIAEVRLVLVGQLADHDGAISAGVLGDLAGRRLDRLADDLDPDLLGVVRRGQAVEDPDRVQQRDPATGDDAFLDRGLGRVHRVVDAVLALLDLDLAAAANPDHRAAPRVLRQPLLQLLAVIVRGGLLDLRLDLGNATVDIVLAAGAVDQRRVLFLDAHLLGAAEHVEGHVLELDA